MPEIYRPRPKKALAYRLALFLGKNMPEMSSFF